MTSSQRQTAFERFFTAVARAASERKGLRYVGTIRMLAPPALPGVPQGHSRYYLNTIGQGEPGPKLVGLGSRADAALRRAERWVGTGKGPTPVASALMKIKTRKRKV